jgi:hypothetical protein
MRYLAWVSQWGHSFVRLFALVRAILWWKLAIIELLKCYGTGRGSYRNLAQPQQAYLPGLD